MMELPKWHATSLYGQPAWSLAVRSPVVTSSTGTHLPCEGMGNPRQVPLARAADGRPLQTAVLEAPNGPGTGRVLLVSHSPAYAANLTQARPS
jgi:hypothetical protein